MKGKLFVVSGILYRRPPALFAPARSTVRATILSRASALKLSLPTTRCWNTPSTSETITVRRLHRFEKPSPTALML